MLLVLSDEHKEHLSFLLQVDAAVVGEFGRIAVEFLRKGASPKIYEGAARKLGVAVETIQHGVEGLMYLLTESSKLMISEIDFQDSVLVLGFSEELNGVLLQLYLANRSEIRSTLTQLTPALPCYSNLEWRLDVLVASRALRQQVVPTVTMRLELSSDGQRSARVLQTDPATLLHLISSLEGALDALKSNHARRILRNIK